jgi:hypothetical protein
LKTDIGSIQMPDHLAMAKTRTPNLKCLAGGERANGYSRFYLRTPMLERGLHHIHNEYLLGLQLELRTLDKYGIVHGEEYVLSSNEFTDPYNCFLEYD